MSLKNKTRAVRVESAEDRAQALKVLSETYCREKNWVRDEEKVFPAADLQDPDVSWFVVFAEDRPVGVLRVLYNPPIALYREYGFKQLVKGLDIEEFVKKNRIAEIGRFAVLPDYRKYIVVVGALMRTAAKETVQKGFTHYITDVFEGEVHSPYDFHTRVMGFQPVATHDVGELNCPNRRITLILDIKASYNRLKTTQKWVYRFLTEDWSEALHKKMLPSEPDQTHTSGTADPRAAVAS